MVFPSKFDDTQMLGNNNPDLAPIGSHLRRRPESSSSTMTEAFQYLETNRAAALSALSSVQTPPPTPNPDGGGPPPYFPPPEIQMMLADIFQRDVKEKQQQHGQFFM
jgi:hypothetical protein